MRVPETAPHLRMALMGWLLVGLGLTSCRSVPLMSGAQPRLKLEVRSVEGARVVRVGETAVATIRFLGPWDDYASLRWDLHFQGARIASGPVPSPGPEPVGRSVEASRRLTDQDCRRAVGRSATLTGGAAEAPMTMTVYVRRVADDEVVEAARAPFSAECRQLLLSSSGVAGTARSSSRCAQAQRPSVGRRGRRWHPEST